MGHSVILFYCFFFLAVAGVKLPGSSVGEGQMLTEDFVYGTLTLKPVSDAGFYQLR